MRHLVALGGHQGLERMHQGIEAGAGGDADRLGGGELRIEDGDAGQRLGIAAGHLLMALLIDDQRIGLAFAPGPGGGRDGDQRQEGLGCRMRVPVVAHATAVGEQEVGALRGIHRAAAAQPDDQVDAPALRYRQAGIDIDSAGILAHLVVDHHHDAHRIEGGAHLLRMPGADDAGIGHQQGVAGAETLGQFPDAAHRTGAEDQAGPLGEIEAGD
jgi:hypothetical protein